MIVNKSELVRLFVTLGQTAARGWSVRALTQKVNAPGGIGAYKEKGFRFTDPKAAALFKAIDDAQDAGALIRVADDTPKPVVKRPKPKPSREKLPARPWHPALRQSFFRI